MIGKEQSGRQQVAAGLFTITAGLVIGYSGLFAYSGIMMLIGFGIGFIALWVFIVGLIRMLIKR